MQTIRISRDFFGVFSPKGELESVEMTEDSALWAAANLSPKQASGAIIASSRRTIAPVTIAHGVIHGDALVLEDAVPPPTHETRALSNAA